MTDFLLIGGGFFGYAKEIAAKLESRGRRVIAFEDRPSLDSLTKVLIRLAPALVALKAEAYFDAIIQSVRHLPIRDVLVIKGESLSVTAIGRLRAALPQARFTLYFWDSYLNMPKGSSAKVPLFDKAFSFDPLDVASDPRLSYRPLFYLDEYAHLPSAKQDIDLLFFGTVHTDRYAVLRRLERSLPAGLRFERVLYFPSSGVYYARRVLDPTFWRARRREFIFKPLSKGDIQSLIARTRTVVDIERAVQAGLTMRTMEMMGAGKKLITTNPQAASAEFFEADNIAVIDRLAPKLPPGFLSKPFRPLSESVLNRYSLSGWLDDVLS
jgi:hypothetical protein